MIPKVIHYCWFGYKPLPSMAIKCIKSWKFFFPDYEIKEWNESNFDVNMISYTEEAYKAKKYAFVSDFARFYILYHYGGVYFDTDVEVIKPMNEILSNGAFMGCESDSQNRSLPSVAPGLGLGVHANDPIYKELIDLYSAQHFIKSDGKLNLNTVVNYTTDILKAHGLKAINSIQNCSGILIYPSEYFCPISVADGKLRITKNTYSIHHYSQSWQSPVRKYGRKILLFLGGEKLKKCFKKVLLNR